jgi:glutamate-1-semialdehyde 2,1-aminomutase
MCVSQAGTLSGNPLAMTAGYEALIRLQGADVYGRLEDLSARLERGLRAAAESAGVPVRINRVGSMQTLFFAEADVTDLESAQACDTARFARFHQAMLGEGVYLPPSQFEAMFVSLAHEKADIDAISAAARRALASL